MRFIEKFKTLARREDNEGLRALLEALANDSETFSNKFNGFGSCYESQEIYFYYSAGEVALLLIDANGCEAELADEEKFNDELPLWFSETSHRLSPFAQIRTLLAALNEVASSTGFSGVQDRLCVLVTNTHIINYTDYIEVFDNLKGAVFYNMQGIDTPIPFAPNDSCGAELFSSFLESFTLTQKLRHLFDPYKPYIKKENTAADTSTPSPESRHFNISDYVEEKDLNDFFALEDPDFRTTEEAVNVETGEKLTVKKDTELPPVMVFEALRDPQAILDEMVGLSQLKTNIAEIIAYARYAGKVREAFPNYAHQSVSLHTIITGNPGTGKTTMCRIYGALLHKAGILSRGHTVVASRSSFIGQQFGTEELRMRQCLKLAQGGCLFIDEAAQLFNHPHPHDPGRGVIQLMLQLLAQEENRDIAVVLALYANDKSLERLYDLNPGIKSRFVNVLPFPDYTWHELLEIAHRKMNAQGLSFTPNAWKRFCSVLRSIYESRDKNYGNAREVVNLLQRCVIKHAVRCEKQNISGKNLLRINVHDIPERLAALDYNKKNLIGFK